jgi:hypothetical protein
MVLDYVALGIGIFVMVVLVYAVIYIHDIPYELARKRNHPHQDAIHVAGWVSLFTLHVIWPFLWIWSMMYRPDRGYGFGSSETAAELAAMRKRQNELVDRVAALEKSADREVS